VVVLRSATCTRCLPVMTLGMEGESFMQTQWTLAVDLPGVHTQ
jgi:hypothetical protein